MILNYDYLQKKNTVKYDKLEVRRLIIKCRKSKSERIVSESKKMIFLSMSNIVMKNIENFFIITKSYKDLIHDRDDLICECYMVLDKCIEKYVFGLDSQFYWYYNKSLTWRMQRIVERTYYKYRDSYRVTEENENYVFSHDLDEMEIDLLEFYFHNFKITPEERKIIDLKISGEKIKEFVENEINMSWNDYYNRLNSVKIKLKPLKDEIN